MAALAKERSSTYCTEGPAGATLLLILDVGDISLIPPVDGVGQVVAFRKPKVGRATARHGGVKGAEAALRNQPFVLLIVLERVSHGRSSYHSQSIVKLNRHIMMFMHIPCQQNRSCPSGRT